MLTEAEAAELATLMRQRERARSTQDSGEPVEVRQARCRRYLRAAFGDDLDRALAQPATDIERSGRHQPATMKPIRMAGNTRIARYCLMGWTTWQKQFAVARDTRRDDPDLTTIRNPGNAG